MSLSAVLDALDDRSRALPARELCFLGLGVALGAEPGLAVEPLLEYVGPHHGQGPGAPRWRVSLAQARGEEQQTLARLAGVPCVRALDEQGRPLEGELLAEGTWTCVRAQAVAVAVNPQRHSLLAIALAPGARLHADAYSAVRLIERAHVESRGGAVLHGAGVSLEGRGLLLLGDKGRGKTTAQLSLLTEAGAALVSSDRAMLIPGSGGAVRMAGWMSSHRTLTGTLDLFPRLAQVPRPTRGAKLELPPARAAAALGFATCPEATLDVLVLARFEAHRPFELAPVGRDELRRELLAARFEWDEPRYPNWLRLAEPGGAGPDELLSRLAELPAVAAVGQGAPTEVARALRALVTT